MKLVLTYHEGDDYYGDTLRTLPLEYESKEKLIEDIKSDINRIDEQIKKWTEDRKPHYQKINELWYKNLNKLEYDTLHNELNTKFPAPNINTFLNIYYAVLYQFDVFTLDEWFEKYKK